VVEEVAPTSKATPTAVVKEAKAKFRSAASKSVEMTATIVGDPQLLAKSVVEVRGISQRLSGKYYVTSARHKLGSGYTTELKLHSTGTKGYPGQAGVGATPPSKAALNTKPPATPEESKDLTEDLVIDPATGQTQKVWVNKGGKGK